MLQLRQDSTNKLQPEGEILPEPSWPLPLDTQIKFTRDYLYHNNKSVLWTHIFHPMAEHGSHLIYAPDELFETIWKHRGKPKELCASIDLKAGLKTFKEKALGNKFFVVLFVAAVGVFKLYGKAISCEMQNVLLGWAEHNRGLSVPMLFGSITLLMCVRMLVSNVLPFTSPVFAFLISQSMPSGLEWAATFFLLACSVPAGLVIPILDEFFFLVYGRRHGHGKENNTDYPEDYDHRFWGTWGLMHLTDWLPFSFWVRPYFMEPVYEATIKAGVGPESAASAAVLAGHFMIWAGPATTMSQRKFVPDWTTCAIIQPLGLMEDVAVVLAAWAGESAASAKKAEIGLYIFMVAMNFVNWATQHEHEHARIARNIDHAQTLTETSLKDRVAAEEDEALAPERRVKEERQNKLTHFIVFLITLAALALCVTTPIHEEVTTTTTTAAPEECASPHENLSTMIELACKVSGIAVAARLVARGVVWALARGLPCLRPPTREGEAKGLKEPLMEKRPTVQMPYTATSPA